MKEVKEYYDKYCVAEEDDDFEFPCDKCKINGVCKDSIGDWELDNNTKPILTQSEIDILKAIKVLYPKKDKLVYGDWDEEFILSGTDVMIDKDRLPSLSHDKEYLIDELLKDCD